MHDVGKIDAREVIALLPKKRSLFRPLPASALRSFWSSLTASRPAEEVLDAEYRQIQEEPPAEKPVEPRDEELERFIAIFKLLRSSGYTLKVIPGTPEENAPTLDFLAEQINRPAA